MTYLHKVQSLLSDLYLSKTIKKTLIKYNVKIKWKKDLICYILCPFKIKNKLVPFSNEGGIKIDYDFHTIKIPTVYSLINTLLMSIPSINI